MLVVAVQHELNNWLNPPKPGSDAVVSSSMYWKSIFLHHLMSKKFETINPFVIIYLVKILTIKIKNHSHIFLEKQLEWNTFKKSR